MDRLTRFVLRHRALVALAWLVAMVAGGATAGVTTQRLAFDFSMPGQPGYETDRQLLAVYGNGGSTPPYVVTVTADGGVESRRADVQAVLDQLREAAPESRVVDAVSAADPSFTTRDGRTTYALVYAPPPVSFAPPPVEERLRAVAEQAGEQSGLDVTLSGYQILAAGGDSEGPSVLTETLLGGVGALLVLLFVFASLLAFLPLLVAAVSILSTFLVVLGLTYLTDVSFVVQFLISLIGLGVAVDYSLLVVNRWREEREHGRDNDEAIAVSMRTAGHAVVSSAGTVAISLMALLVVPVPFLRSMGLGGMLIPLVSTAVTLTLLPALLSAVGPRVDWPRIRHESSASRGWTAWARVVVRRPWLAAAAALILLGLLVAPLLDLRIGTARTESLASGGPAYEALTTLRDGGVPAGVVSPLEVLVRGRDGLPADAVAGQVVETARGVQGVAAAYAPDEASWRKDGTAVVSVIPVEETVDSDNAKIVDRLAGALASTPGVVGIAGSGAVVQDYLSAVYGSFPLVIAIISLATFLLLVRAFRSLLLPLKAVLLNIVSVAATFGATVLFWQLGHGSDEVFDVQATGAITFWVPVVIFAFLFGLSMDYEVFILARMREEYDASGSTETAVVQGLGRTGRLVTCAALILFLAFTALASSPGTDVKVLATALGAGILIDATIVRALLVPALVALFGRWNWWLPASVARVLRVEPHAAVPEPRRAQEAREVAPVG